MSFTVISFGVSEAQTPEQTANANASAAIVTGDDEILQLAIPVEVSAGGVRVVGEGQIIRAPRPQPGSGPRLQITIEGKSPDSEFKRQYVLSDPRMSELEGRGEEIAKHARTFVYVELNDWASRVHVTPQLQKEFEPLASALAFGKAAQSTIQLSDVARKVCAGEYADLPMCVGNKGAQ
jgi:hypothetical protein